MPAAAIPIAMGASALINYFSARKAAQRTPEETAALQTQTNASNQLITQGQQLTNFGLPKLQQAGNYFSTLMGGNRAALQQQLAPDVANINDVYGGTQRTLARFLRGPDRDYQMGELSRQRAGAIGSLFTGARDRAAGTVLNLGQYGVGQGTNALGAAAGVSNAAGQSAFQNRAYGNQITQQAGAGTAQLLFSLLQSYLNRGGGSSFASVPNIPTTSGWAGSGFGG